MDINQYSEQYIKFVTDSFITSMTAQISRRVVDNVSEVVNRYDVKSEIDRQIDEIVNQAIAKYRSSNLDGVAGVGENLVQEFRLESQKFIDSLSTDVKTNVITELRAKVNSIDISSMIREQCNLIVTAAIANNTLNFPDRSIPGSSIDTSQIQIRAENILPGMIKKFSSTGIEDLAENCQITITDHFTIMENKLVAQDLEIRGAFNVNGAIDPKFSEVVADLAVSKIEKTYSDGTFDQYVNRVLIKLDQEGFDATKVKVQNKPLVENSTLNNTVTNSNLRRVGLLSELEVAGESLFDDTLYVSGGKVGVNTRDPEHTFDFWDQEVQVILSKREKDKAYFGSLKNQSIVLGTNGRDQLILDANGKITVEQLTIGKITQSSSPWEPTDNRQLGEIVWNEQPQIGQPIGWVSLGGARWARFGTITE